MFRMGSDKIQPSISKNSSKAEVTISRQSKTMLRGLLRNKKTILKSRLALKELLSYADSQGFELTYEWFEEERYYEVTLKVKDDVT